MPQHQNDGEPVSLTTFEKKTSFTPSGLEGLELYREIDRGNIAHGEVSIPTLFTLASALAVSGRLDLKNKVLSDWVTNHPDVLGEPDAMMRVKINSADWERRLGQPNHALELLAALEITDHMGAVAQVEYWQALNQCLLLNAKAAATSAERIEILSSAVENQHKLCEIALASPEIAADKKIYYLVGLCEHRGHLMQAEGRQQDRHIEWAHKKCREIAANDALPSAFQKRVAWELPFNEGIYFLSIGQFERSLSLLGEAWGALRVLNDVRVKTAVAVHLLYSSFKIGSGSSDPLFGEVKNFYLSPDSQSLLASDRQLFKEIQDFVNSQL